MIECSIKGCKKPAVWTTGRDGVHVHACPDHETFFSLYDSFYEIPSDKKLTYRERKKLVDERFKKIIKKGLKKCPECGEKYD